MINPTLNSDKPNLLFQDGGLYHIQISPSICSAKQWAGFYNIGTSVMKELKGCVGRAIKVLRNTSR